MPDYPPVPPGVMTFDPRRLRRHRRKMAEISERQRLVDEKRIAQAERVAAIRALHQEQRRSRELAEAVADSIHKGNVFSKVADKLKRFVTRGRKS